ncbi:DUF4371 domain-containing protein [Citrus sinensis]|nr:DUF4371 domain-containing protein [Citrus sinensis]
MGKSSKIDQYFKRKTLEESSNPPVSENSPISHVNSPKFENQLSKSPRIETSKVDTQLVERDPGLHRQIWDYDVNQQDEIRRAYIMSGPYQPRLPEYPKSGSEKHPRRFQSLWFDSFPSWLEYSPTKDAAFCLPSTLKDGIHYVLSHHNLNIQNIRGQGYDGASNMRGEWKGLQALILKDCPYAYYIHYLAHRLQLALVAVSHEVVHVHHFFTKLTSIANIVGASCKRHDELKRAQAADIEYMISIDELESGRWLNQIVLHVQFYLISFNTGQLLFNGEMLMLHMSNGVISSAVSNEDSTRSSAIAIEDSVGWLLHRLP